MTTPLITSLEQAGEGSRELDKLVALATTHPYGVDAADWDGFPAYTTSVDCALALAERVLPGWFISLERYSDGWYATVCDHSTSQRRFQGSQKPAALALCLAILKATHQEQPNV